MKFWQIRGATSVVEYADARILVDPFFAEKDAYPPLEDSFHPELRWPTAPLPCGPDEITHGIDAVLVTHLHPDHLDEAAVKALDKKIKLFTQDEWDAEHISTMGFTNVEILQCSGTVFKRATLYKTDCVHGLAVKTKPYYDKLGIRGDACGAVFMGVGEPVFYLAGDTIWTDCVRKTIEKYSPDVIAVNAAGAQLRESGLIIMGTEDVRKVREAAPKACIVVTHMDAVPHASVSRDDMKKFIAENHIENIYVPEDGETLNL